MNLKNKKLLIYETERVCTTPFGPKYKRKNIFLIYWESNVPSLYFMLDTLDS
jgi:hypothetical protein